MKFMIYHHKSILQYIKLTHLIQIVQNNKNYFFSNKFIYNSQTMPKKKQQSEQSDKSDDDSDNQKVKIELNRPKIDRILKDNINLKKIIINVSMTQYPVVTQVAQELNWKVQTNPESGDWDIFWTDFSIEPDILIRMHFHQKINHYPGIYVIARKNLLGLNLMNMRTKFPDEYNFFPLTWMLPSQYSQFRIYYQSVTKGKVRTYIVKPEAQCQGRGIFLTRNIEDLQNGSHYVIQRYVTKPYLIDGLKFDLRIYVLLAGTDPLRLYIYEQGLARFATQPYVQPNSNNLDQTYIHLTNYAINKFNPKFVFNKGVNDMSTGHKRSLTSVYKLLQKKGENVTELKRKINDIIIKTLLTSNPLMSHQYRHSQPQQYSGNMCFHILGIDVLITESFQPLLLQVNHTPSFTTDTPLDNFIKHNLIKDTLILMNINTKVKTHLYKKAKQFNHQRLLTGKRQIFQGDVKQKQLEKAQKERDQFENKHLGGFQKIHPTENAQRKSMYNEILQYANKCYLQENTLRARMQQRQAKKMMKQQIKLFKQKKSNIKSTQKIQTDVKINTKTQTVKTKMIKSAMNQQQIKTNEIKSMKDSHLTNSHLTNSQLSIERVLVSKDKKPVYDISQMVKMTKESIREISEHNVERKFISIYEKCCRTKIQLPHLPIDQKSSGVLSSQSELVQKKQTLHEKDFSIKKSINIQLPKNSYDPRFKLSKVKKMVQDNHNYVNRLTNKTGNFLMPKIYDLNVNADQMKQQNFAILKINAFTKYSNVNDQ